jgi:hypothetical protein
MKQFVSILFFLLSGLLSVNAQYTDLRDIINPQMGQSVIEIPNGTYEMSTISGPHYIFDALKNVVINGNGSTVYCKSNSMAFQFQNCENVTLKNLTIDYDPVCYTQGTIISVSNDSKIWKVKLHDGYPTQGIAKQKLELFDPLTKLVKKNLFNIQTGDYDMLQSASDPTVIDITIKRTITAGIIKQGEYVVMSLEIPTGMSGHTIFIWACKNFIAENVTIYGSNMMSIIEHDCENSKYLNCNITRNPNDPTKSVPRLRSGNFDGIHSKHALIGPTIENCIVQYNGDDGIAVNGRFYLVYKVDQTNNYVYLLSKEEPVRIIPGDKMAVVDNGGSMKGSVGILENITIIPSDAEKTACTAKFTALLSPGVYQTGARIKIENWPLVGIALGDYVYSENRIGAGFKITNCTVGHNAGRGLLIKSSNGLIKNNLVEGTQLGGIVLAPEISWCEAGHSNNVQIIGNTVRNCVFASSHAGMTQPAAITVINLNGANQISPNGAHNNITIMDNVIDNCPRPGIVVTSTKGLNYYNNTFPNNTTVVRTHGTTWGVVNNIDFWTMNVTNINYTEVKQPELNEPVITFDQNNNSILLNNYLQNGYLSIVDLSGREVVKYQLTAEIKTLKIPQDLKGFFIVNLSAENINISRKIILN